MWNWIRFQKRSPIGQNTCSHTHTHTHESLLSSGLFFPISSSFLPKKVCLYFFKQTSKINKKWQNTPLTRFCCVAAKSATFLQLRRLPHRSCDFRLLLRSPSDMYIHKHNQQQQQSQMFEAAPETYVEITSTAYLIFLYFKITEASRLNFLAKVNCKSPGRCISYTDGLKKSSTPFL